MDRNLETALYQSRYQRLNTIILKDEVFNSNFSTELEAFLKINTPSASNTSVLRKICKAYARVNYFILCNKEAPVAGETKLLMDKEKAYIDSPSPPLWQEITTLTALLLEMQRRKLSILDRFYEHGDKAGNFLAYNVKQQQLKVSLS